MRRYNDNLLRPLPLTLLILACLGLLFVTAALANTQHLVWGEAGILEAVYRLPDWLTPVFILITWLGSFWFLGLQSFLLVLVKRPYRAVYLMSVGSLAWGMTEIVKALVGRPRPAGLLGDITQRDVFASGYGFPSGHTALATALALTVIPWLPSRFRWLGYLWISLVPFLAEKRSKAYLRVR